MKLEVHIERRKEQSDFSYQASLVGPDFEYHALGETPCAALTRAVKLWGQSPADVDHLTSYIEAALAGTQMQIVKTGNTDRNLGKSPAKVLAEILATEL
jgi:hypothetical protein